MKFRTDFVTNSSSTSYIIARKQDLSEEVKDRLFDFFSKEFLGKEVLSPDATDEEILKFFDEFAFDDQDQLLKEYKELLDKGDSIYYCEHWIEGDEAFIELEEKFLRVLKQIPSIKILLDQTEF